MPGKYRGNKRKSFQVPESKAQTAETFAALNEISVSELVYEWAQSFVENGSDFTPDPPAVIQSIGDPEVWEKAEQRAREEFGVGFREIVLFEIGEINTL